LKYLLKEIHIKVSKCSKLNYQKFLNFKIITKNEWLDYFYESFTQWISKTDWTLNDMENNWKGKLLINFAQILNFYFSRFFETIYLGKRQSNSIYKNKTK
jgi:hypothetical protein